MTIRAAVNAARCVGHGMCSLAAPEVFQLSDEDGHAIVALQSVPSDLRWALEQAQRGCPEDAITIHDDAAACGVSPAG